MFEGEDKEVASLDCNAGFVLLEELVGSLLSASLVDEPGVSGMKRSPLKKSTKFASLTMGFLDDGGGGKRGLTGIDPVVLDAFLAFNL